MDTSRWVNEVEGVVDGFMCQNIVKPLDSVIGTPFVGMYGCSWAYMVLYDGEEGDCCLVRDNLHVAQCWALAAVNQPKHPNFLTCSTPPMVLLGFIIDCG